MTETEKRLLEGCLAHRRDAQFRLYKTFSDKMMGVCLRYAGGREEAEDMLQNGFIKVFEKLDSFSGRGSLEGWIRKVMINSALDYLRRYRKEQWHQNLDALTNPPAQEEYILTGLAADDLLALIQTMPPGFRSVFNLYAIEGYTHKEVAGQLGISENTSKSQYSRARAYLQKLLEKKESKTSV